MDELIRLCAAAARIACLRMTPLHLKVPHESVEQARRMPFRFAWDRKVAAHAGIFNLLADVAGDPVLAVPLRDARGHISDLMVTVGPAADGIILSSRRRLLALIRVGEADDVACEMEQHLGGTVLDAAPVPQLSADRHRCLTPADLADLEAAEFPAGTLRGGLDVVAAQKMESIPPHEVICNSSLVRDWRVAQLTRLGIPRPLAEAVAADVDWHQVAALVHRGCPPRLALHIVR